MYNPGEIVCINFIYNVSINTHISPVHQLVWTWISNLKCYSVLKAFSLFQSMFIAVYSTFPTHHLPFDTTNLISNVGWKEVHEQQISNKLADFQVNSSTRDTSNHCMDDVSSSCSVYRLPLHPVFQLSVYRSGHKINRKTDLHLLKLYSSCYRLPNQYHINSPSRPYKTIISRD